MFLFKHTIKGGIIFFLLMLGCRDKENAPIDVTIEGYAIDLVTKDSVPDAEIYILEDDKGGSNEPRNYDRVIARTTTDKNGHYVTQFRCFDQKTKAVLAKKKNYYYSESLGMDRIHCDTKQSNPDLSPLSWMKIHIKNINPISSEDSIYFHNGVPLSGTNVDTVFYREFESIHPRIDVWHITKNQQTVRKSHMRVCPPLDTCTLEIFY